MSFHFGAQCIHRIPGPARWVDLTGSIRSESDEDGHGCDSIQESRPKMYQTFRSAAACEWTQPAPNQEGLVTRLDFISP